MGFTDLEPEEALKIYHSRIKIEEAFRDLKSLLGLEKIMNKRIALLLLAYGIGLLVGEAIREGIYSGKKKLCSGLFILLKQQVRVNSRDVFKAHGKSTGNFQANC